MQLIEDIAEAINSSRDAFGNVFLRAQTAIPPAQRILFDAIATSGNDQEDFKAAIRVAQAEGWHDALLDAVIDEGLENGRLAKSTVEAELKKNNQNAALQAITNVARAFAQPDILYRGIANAMKWTGKVSIDGIAKGTGILIGPHLVLTAWHVVSELFEKDAADKWVPRQSSGPRIQVEFGNFLSIVNRGQALQPAPSTQVKAHNDWCVSYSACQDDELNNSLPEDLTLLDNHWDYVIIKLSRAIGLERRWAPLDARATVPMVDESVIVFQHPGGHTMKVDQGKVGGVDPPNPKVFPRIRFLHHANTMSGSSGGPCFDKHFMLFGLHQGQWDGHGGIKRWSPTGEYQSLTYYPA
ncbi:trypsin-like serine peptidase [Hymenobacter cellulosilyticus]|uniref:Serine protease n=1 Tax=Hymenobacter cellulosilyticus TaxID=2932248 RepID=A0A8T9QGH5_9BACT|nr:serine protease [Hymenobacter cellulosilyticus]UOQ75258.1 serine protease [Hymenobacter cellulosilyticus]